jgi:hypothetical protein
VGAPAETKRLNCCENRDLDREFGGQPSHHLYIQISRLRHISRFIVNLCFPRKCLLTSQLLLGLNLFFELQMEGFDWVDDATTIIDGYAAAHPSECR